MARPQASATNCASVLVSGSWDSGASKGATGRQLRVHLHLPCTKASEYAIARYIWRAIPPCGEKPAEPAPIHGVTAMGVGDARRQLNGPQARARPLLSSSASPEAITTRVSMPSSTE